MRGTCLSSGGWGRGSKGGGEGVQGGGVLPQPAGTYPIHREQKKHWRMNNPGHGNVMLSAVNEFIIECQFRVPTSHQYTTTTTKRDIHHPMPNDGDLCCQSELNSPELEPPSVVELELESDDDDEPESLPEWETSHNLSNSASSCCLIIFLSFPSSGPIFKPKIEQRVNYVFTLCAWRRLDRGAKIH